MERDNIQKLFTLKHDLDVEEINLLNTEIELETKKQQREINALKIRAVKLIEAEN